MTHDKFSLGKSDMLYFFKRCFFYYFNGQ